MFPARIIACIVALAWMTGQPLAAQTLRAPTALTLKQAYELSRRADTEEELSRVIQLCETALAAKPNSKSTSYAQKLQGWSREARGELYVENGRFSEALSDYDAALLLEPRRARTLRLRGECLALLGRSDEAIVDLDKAIELNNDNVQAHFMRGEVRRGAGKYTGAVDDYSQALRLDPKHVGAMMGRGDALYRLGLLGPAVRDYTAALRNRKQDASLYTRRGNAQADLGHYTAAADDFRRAMRIDPSHRQAFQSAAWLMSTCPDERYRQPTLAMELAKRAVELDGKEDHRCLETLAAALANGGFYQEAKRVQERAIRYAPKAAIPHSTARLELFVAGKPYRDRLH